MAALTKLKASNIDLDDLSQKLISDYQFSIDRIISTPGGDDSQNTILRAYISQENDTKEFVLTQSVVTNNS